MVLRVGLSRSGTSAWIAAEIKTAGVTIFDDTTRHVTLRASGFLVLDRGTWRVRAADLSRAIRDKVAAPGCGNASHQWSLAEAPPKQLAAPVREMLAAFNRGADHAAHVSDDRAVLVLGSAPGEQYSGAAAKKSVKRWDISSTVFGNEHDDDLRALAGLGPGSEMMWIAAPIMAPAKFCAEYRGFFVVAKEAAGWKFVHEHFSTPM